MTKKTGEISSQSNQFQSRILTRKHVKKKHRKQQKSWCLFFISLTATSNSLSSNSIETQNKKQKKQDYTRDYTDIDLRQVELTA